MDKDYRQELLEEASRSKHVVIGGKSYPSWLITLHEEIHDELGHDRDPFLKRTIYGHVTPGKLQQEKQVWRVTAVRLREEDRWTPEVKNIAVEVLSKYYEGIPNARQMAERFIHSL